MRSISAAAPRLSGVMSLPCSALPTETRSSPEGFAHGYCTLEPDTEVIYKVSAYYSPEHDRGLLWCDPTLGITWPVAADKALISDKDRTHPNVVSSAAIFSI